jgi:hypothetical protein
MLLGGCISATVGASILANGQIDSGSTTFSASLVADQNVLSHCMLDSRTNGEEQASSAFGGDVSSLFSNRQCICSMTLVTLCRCHKHRHRPQIFDF